MNKSVTTSRRRKSIASLLSRGSPEHALKSTLGPGALVALAMGAMLSAQFLVLPGIVAARYSGPGIAVSFLIGGITTVLASLCSTELSSRIPIAGSAYTYSYASLGETAAWNVGWLAVLFYSCGGALAIKGWQLYFASLLNNLGLGSLLADIASRQLLIATIILAAVLTVLVLGTRESFAGANAVTLTAIIVPVVFILVTSTHVQLSNLAPFIPSRTPEGRFGWIGIFGGAAVLVGTYAGIDVISTATGETRTPQKDIPLAMFISIALVTFIYEGLAFSLVGTVPYGSLGVADPLAYALNYISKPRTSLLISIGALALLTWFLRLMMLGFSRLVFSFSHDGLLPPSLAHIHPRYRTPVRSVLLSAPLILLLFSLQLDRLAELQGLALLLLFTIQCLGVIYLRTTDSSGFAEFRVPFFPFTPLAAIALCVLLACFLSWQVWILLVIWVLIGFAIYLGYGRRHSPFAKDAGTRHENQ